ncbi:MAG TPA: hypothetical protein VFG14_07760 [Chthoniobacteraceae bacterium]|nr:hypothetical protein [Chthoniobacteraceae bacterium]
MNFPHPSAARYQSYGDLPVLAGLCSMAEAQCRGLSVEECVRRLKRFHYALKRLHEIFVARITAEPIYELKMAFSLHGHYCAEHVTALRARVGEMREPPLGLDIVPDDNLAILFDEIQAAPTTHELLTGIYAKAVPALIEGLERHIADTNPLSDAPTVRVARFALLELNDLRAYGVAAIGKLAPRGEPSCQAGWLALLDSCLAAAGGLDGASEPERISIQRQYSAVPYVFDGVPKRDARFPDPYNMGVNAEAFLYDPNYAPEPKVLMMFYKRLREIDVPEMMSSIITETKGKPWGYYRDMTRQLWDEARHAMMGEVGFVNAGVDWRKVMVNFTWSLGLNTQLTPKERHGVLYFIEQGLMPKTGKRFEWETAREAHNALSALFQDYDWADEVLHARVGRDWYVSQFENPKEAVEWGDRAWSKVLMGWSEWRDKGLTQHRNWWPDVYLDYCRAQELMPDEKVVEFSESYEAKRADLKVISG